MDPVERGPQEEPPSADENEAAYRGFLFSDLRGYTAFVERHGNQAAAQLIDVYRDLVRAEVARHHGAEIRTEGDSFYVVFPSAQRAVTCALGIVGAAASHNQAHPEVPISVGVGVHAGETIERPEGYIGSAVNLAARVCAKARAGEVLVTATVRELTRSGIPVEFDARGSHRLKGVAEPVALFSARPADASKITSQSSRLLLPLIAALIGAGVVVWVAIDAQQRGPNAGAITAPSGSSTMTSVSSLPSASSEPTGTFPTIAEERLLARLDAAIARHCERADAADVPELDESSVITPLAYDAGLECRLGSLSEPDTVWYWSAVTGQRHEQVSAIFLQTAGRRSIPPGDCATDDFAHGRWEFGQLQGRLLCYGSRNATLVWTYDDSVLATAIRSDGDMRALYTWWRDNARLLGG